MYLSQNPACNPLCNVCHYKKLDYEEQLSRKQEWAKSNLGGWPEALRPIIPAPESERLAYRAKTWLRSFFEDENLSFGAYRAVQADGKWKQEFVSWNTCPIHVRAIQEMTGRLREVLALQARGFSRESLFGVWMGSPHLVLVARTLELSLLQAIDWSQILRPPFDRVWLHRTNQVGKTVFQHKGFHRIFGPPGEDEHPILAFRQVALTLLTEARELARSHLMAASPSFVVDLYCGTGELSLLLPSSVGWLGIEASRPAVAYAGKLRVSPGILHEAFAGTIEQRLKDPRILQKIGGRYALYLNPPRSGLSAEARERVLTMIQAHPPATVVVLSCSASSLARDLKPFESLGYRVSLLQPYDFFPQTEHFETLAVLST